MSDPDEMDAALAAEVERRIGVAEDRRLRLANPPAPGMAALLSHVLGGQAPAEGPPWTHTVVPPEPEEEDEEHDCVPPFCDHPSHEDGPLNDDWIADAYERQAQWREDRW